MPDGLFISALEYFCSERAAALHALRIACSPRLRFLIGHAALLLILQRGIRHGACIVVPLPALIHKCLRNAILVFPLQPVHLPVSNRVICIVHLWSSRLDEMVVAIGPVIQLLPTQ